MKRLSSFSSLVLLSLSCHKVIADPTATTTAIPTSVPTEPASSTQVIGGNNILPPNQTWCPSTIFCAGQILQALNLATPYSDSKTIVDKPTNKASSSVISDFALMLSNVGGVLSDLTIGDIVEFLDNDFRGEGLELEGASLSSFTDSPKFLDKITDSTVKGFAKVVHEVWPSLIRQTNPSELCHEGTSTTCESTLIPLNHTFVVPGGRFREQYYWDSFWILEGLYQSELFDIAKDTLENFMDEIETIGFIPNGGRIYYLDRSQPPMFIRMLFNYVGNTGDVSILDRALPLAEKELKWWKDHRSLKVKSPFTHKKHLVYRYDVNNTAPRPESYLEDYQTTDGTDLTPNYFTPDEKMAIWAELASGAETGWDYSSRFVKQPNLNIQNTSYNLPGLRTLNVRSHVPVCLNSILYNAHMNMKSLYEMKENYHCAKRQRKDAIKLRDAIMDLTWDHKKLAFYDFNLTSNCRNKQFTTATFYPLWAGIIPEEVQRNEADALGFFAVVNMVLSRYNGTFPTTFLNTGLQWDAPNAWPPHNYIAMQALLALPDRVTRRGLPQLPDGSFSAIPEGQLGLNENELPLQPIDGGGNITASGKAADVNSGGGTWLNGGYPQESESWRDALVRGLANRYIGSALCSFHASGGSIPGILSPLPPDQRITGASNLTGLLFEKFSMFDVTSAGRGGEYTVQAGFGWTNGVILWTSSNFGDVLSAPTCPSLHNGTDT